MYIIQGQEQLGFRQIDKLRTKSHEFRTEVTRNVAFSRYRNEGFVKKYGNAQLAGYDKPASAIAQDLDFDQHVPQYIDERINRIPGDLRDQPMGDDAA